MAHNLFRDQMAFVGEAPWHGLGTRVPPGITSKGMLMGAGLAWEVRKIPAIGAKVVKGQASEAIYDRYFLQRDPVGDEREGPVLGVVGARYEVLQNHEAFGFFDPFLSAEDARYEAAGALGNGERVWVQVRMGNPIEVADGDAVHRFILLSNSHDGRGAVSLRFTPIRVVCQNTLNLALDGGDHVVNLRHSKRVRDRLADHQVEFLLRTVEATFASAAEQFRRLAGTTATAERREQYLEAMFPRTKEQQAAGGIPKWWGGIAEGLADERVTPRKTRDTMWGLYNAVTHAEDYRKTTETMPDARLERIWFGRGAELKIKALQTAVQLCEVR